MNVSIRLAVLTVLFSAAAASGGALAQSASGADAPMNDGRYIIKMRASGASRVQAAQGDDSDRGRRAAVSAGPGGRTSRGPDAAMLDDDDKALFERLRVVRRELADEAGVPAYIVFGDKVLLEMVARRPGSSRELLQVPGVGEAKLERYGAAFLDVLRG